MEFRYPKNTVLGGLESHGANHGPPPIVIHRIGGLEEFYALR